MYLVFSSGISTDITKIAYRNVSVRKLSEIDLATLFRVLITVFEKCFNFLLTVFNFLSVIASMIGHKNFKVGSQDWKVGSLHFYNRYLVGIFLLRMNLGFVLGTILCSY